MKNKKLAINILSNDCEIAGHYYKNGETCALGALALEAGVSRKHLATHNNDIKQEECCLIAEAIERKFGLTLKQQARIQKANDDVDKYLHPKDHVERRRAAVLRIVRRYA